MINMKIQHHFVLSLFFAICYLQVFADSSSNTVPVTANLTFYLETKTGGVGPANQFNSDEMICWALISNVADGTNIVFFRNMPSVGEAFSISLFGKNGAEIPKTKLGNTFSKPLRQPRNEEDLIQNFKNDGIRRGVLHDFVRPDEMFVIKTNGVYYLEVRMRICVPMTNGVPDTNAMLDYRKAYAATNCGIIESPPLRVKVVKD